MIYFGAPKRPGNRAFEADIHHTGKVAPTDMQTKIDGKPEEHFWAKTGIFKYFGNKCGPKIGPLRSILSIHLKVLAMSMWNDTDVKPMKTFWEKDKRLEFWFTVGLKMAQELGLCGPYWLYTSLKVAPMTI